MIDPRDPVRLRHLDPLLRKTIESAHAALPNTAAVEALVRAVEQAAGLHVPASAVTSSSAASMTAATFKSLALKLTVVAAVSSGLCWVTIESLWPQSPSASHVSSTVTSRSAAEVEVPTARIASRPHNTELPEIGADTTRPTQPVLPSSEPKPRHATAPATQPRSTASSVPLAARPVFGSPQSLPPLRHSTPNARRSDAAHTKNAAPTRPDERRRPVSMAVEHAESHVASSELALLDQAQRALRTAPEHAFALTEQHREQHPHGHFAQEREQIAIEALFGARRFVAMRERAARFRTAFPRSAHTARIVELIEAAP